MIQEAMPLKKVSSLSEGGRQRFFSEYNISKHSSRKVGEPKDVDGLEVAREEEEHQVEVVKAEEGRKEEYHQQNVGGENSDDETWDEGEDTEYETEDDEDEEVFFDEKEEDEQGEDEEEEEDDGDEDEDADEEEEDEDENEEVELDEIQERIVVMILDELEETIPFVAAAVVGKLADELELEEFDEELIESLEFGMVDEVKERMEGLVGCTSEEVLARFNVGKLNAEAEIAQLCARAAVAGHRLILEFLAGNVADYFRRRKDRIIAASQAEVDAKAVAAANAVAAAKAATEKLLDPR